MFVRNKMGAFSLYLSLSNVGWQSSGSHIVLSLAVCQYTLLNINLIGQVRVVNILSLHHAGNCVLKFNFRYIFTQTALFEGVVVTECTGHSLNRRLQSSRMLIELDLRFRFEFSFELLSPYLRKGTPIGRQSCIVIYLTIFGLLSFNTVCNAWKSL